MTNIGFLEEMWTINEQYSHLCNGYMQNNHYENNDFVINWLREGEYKKWGPVQDHQKLPLPRHLRWPARNATGDY